MLIEFQVNLLPDSYKKQFYDLKINGTTPIIAHPERYKFVQNDISIVEEWLNSGCLIPVDAGSVLGTLGKSSKITSEGLLKMGGVKFLVQIAMMINIETLAKILLN